MNRFLWCTFVLFLLPAIAPAQLIPMYLEYGSVRTFTSKAYYDKGLLYSAQVALRQSIESLPENPTHDRADLLSSSIEYSAGNPTGADASLQQFVLHRPNSPYIAHAWIERGIIAFQVEHFEESITFFTEAYHAAEHDFGIRKDTLYQVISSQALYWIGVAYIRQGKHDDARLQFELMLSSYPKSEFADDALYSLGFIAESNHRTDTAISFFGLIRLKYPRRNTHIAASIREASNELRLRDYSSALLLIASAENALRHIELADSIGKLFEPQTNITGALEEILYLRAQAFSLAGRFDTALSVFTEFTNSFPLSSLRSRADLGKGWALLNLLRYSEAAAVYQRVIDSSTKEESTTTSLAQLYHAVALKYNGNREQALQEFSTLSLQGGYPYLAQVLLESGQMYYENLQYDNARKALERAERESPDAATSVRIQLFLGATYLEQQAYNKSARAYIAAEKLARASTIITLPLRDKYLAESRLKQGIAFCQNMQQREAIAALTLYIGENGSDGRKEDAIFWLAESYYRSDLLKNSEELYRQILEDYPAGSHVEGACYGLGWTFFRKQDFAKSAEFFTKLVKQFPDTRYGTEALIRKGDGHYILKDYRNAASAYQAAFARSPHSDEGQYAAFQIGQALYRQRDYDKSVEAFRNYVKSYPKSSLAPRAYYSIGWSHFQQKKYEESIRDLQKLIELYPSSDLLAQANYSIGDGYYNLGNFEKAIESYKVVLNSFPTSPYAGEAVKSMQFCLESLGRTEEAVQIADTFIEANPQLEVSKELSFNKAFKFSSGKNYSSAIAEFENYLKKYPENDRNAEALYYLEKSYSGMNDHEKAEQTFKELQKKFPKSEFTPLGLLELGKMNLAQQRAIQADSFFHEVQIQYPANPAAAEAGFERAQINFTKGDTVKALALYREIATEFKNNEYADQSRYRLGMYLRNKGLADSARAELAILAARAEENPPLAAEAAFRIDESWLREKKYDSAIVAFKIVREKFSGVEDWYTLSMIGLGECYEQAKEFDAAREIYQTILNLRPTDDFGKTAQSRLKRLPKTP
ncbi:MAG: tetratricopeptide repeat protein [Ignavibacteria bacterium]|nr:tetratricopeptide repeat protein [Ignavibacteria bacterium]